VIVRDRDAPRPRLDRDRDVKRRPRRHRFLQPRATASACCRLSCWSCTWPCSTSSRTCATSTAPRASIHEALAEHSSLSVRSGASKGDGARIVSVRSSAHVPSDRCGRSRAPCSKPARAASALYALNHTLPAAIAPPTPRATCAGPLLLLPVCCCCCLLLLLLPPRDAKVAEAGPPGARGASWRTPRRAHERASWRTCEYLR
jgi:hypothetical protein